MTTKDKLIEYLKLRGVSKTKFYSETGLSNGFLASGKSLSVDNLKIIISKFPDINLDWLIRDMETEPADIVSVNEPSSNYTGCNHCREKQKQIEDLQRTIDILLSESQKDRSLIRELIQNIDCGINKQSRSA